MGFPLAHDGADSGGRDYGGSLYQLDFVCSYAGDLNPMLVDWLAMHHIRPDFAIPIFSHDLNLNGGLGTTLLLIGLGVALAMLFAGIVIAQRRSRSALANSDDSQVGATSLRT